MTYVLREATAQDKEKILQDAIKFKKSWRFPTQVEYLKMTLAVNEEKGFYMYRAPLTSEPDRYNRFHFYFKDVLYELYVGRAMEGPLCLEGTIASELLPEFQQEIRDAFLVHNRRGRPLGEIPEDWINKINPELKVGN